MILTTKKEKKLRAEIEDLKIENGALNGALKTFSGTMESNFCNLMTELRAKLIVIKAENEKLKQRNPQVILTTKKEKKLRAEISRLKKEQEEDIRSMSSSMNQITMSEYEKKDLRAEISRLKAENEDMEKNKIVWRLLCHQLEEKNEQLRKAAKEDV